MSPVKNNPRERTVKAKDLSANDIDSLATFLYRMHQSRVEAKVLGAQIRQIYHTSTETTINVCHVEDTSGDLAEFTLDHDAEIDLS